MQWISRPPADRGLALSEANDIAHLVRNASEVTPQVLRALLEAQKDLIDKCGKGAFGAAEQRAQLADLVAQSLAILVQESENVPAQTGESLSKTRLLLEAVQDDSRLYREAAPAQAPPRSPQKSQSQQQQQKK